MQAWVDKVWLESPSRLSWRDSEEPIDRLGECAIVGMFVLEDCIPG